MPVPVVRTGRVLVRWTPPVLVRGAWSTWLPGLPSGCARRALVLSVRALPVQAGRVRLADFPLPPARLVVALTLVLRRNPVVLGWSVLVLPTPLAGVPLVALVGVGVRLVGLRVVWARWMPVVSPAQAPLVRALWAPLG